MALPTELFEQFQDYLNKEQELREVSGIFLLNRDFFFICEVIYDTIFAPTCFVMIFFSFQQIRAIVRDIDGASKKAALQLQVIHNSIENGNFSISSILQDIPIG